MNNAQYAGHNSNFTSDWYMERQYSLEWSVWTVAIAALTFASLFALSLAGGATAQQILLAIS